jgi:hypothetical protein
MDGIIDCMERYLLIQCGIVVGLERCLWYGVRWKVSHLRKVMLKSAKHQFWRVDTLGQQVPSCGMFLTFIKVCSDLLASHHRSVIVLGRHGNMEVF